MIELPNRQDLPPQTPEGFEFPYSHFGDPDERIQLLKDINKRLNINPQTVLNMGSGYDVTPSYAFPDARVIHVDLAPYPATEETPGIVDFLKTAGFEAYTPDDLPDDFTANLVISILCPAYIEDKVSPGGIILKTTSGRDIPDEMKIEGLVEDIEGDFRIVDDAEAVQELWESNREIHLAAFKKTR